MRKGFRKIVMLSGTELKATGILAISPLFIFSGKGPLGANNAVRNS